MKKSGVLFRIVRKFRAHGSNEAGVTLIEALVSLATLGIIAAVFLSGLSTTAKASLVIDEQATAESLARSQMEYVKTVSYVYDATGYTAAPIPSGEDYANYSVSIYAEPLNNPDDGIQKITVTAKHYDKEVLTFESYKVNR